MHEGDLFDVFDGLGVIIIPVMDMTELMYVCNSLDFQITKEYCF